MPFEPIKTQPREDGVQKIYHFENGYGASVIRHKYSYGGDEGLWELGVLIKHEEDHWALTYNTPITNDVIGYLTDEAVEEVLWRIHALNNKLCGNRTYSGEAYEVE
jgi:hypothetical protein